MGTRARNRFERVRAEAGRFFLSTYDGWAGESRSFGDKYLIKLERIGGVLDFDQYAALGDGRSVALVGLDGSVDWWCVPNLDSPPLFDQILRDGTPEAGCFKLAPTDPEFSVSRRYLPDSNVLETTFTTSQGTAKITESLNSGLAGRLPWSELARRVEGIEGRVEFRATMAPGTRFGADTPEAFTAPNGRAFQVGEVVGTVRYDDQWTAPSWEGPRFSAACVVGPGDRAVIALLASQAEPLILPKIEEIDARIEVSDRAWREWTTDLGYDGLYPTEVKRSALALKLLIFSPTGSIAAAATTSLPERVGGPKNYDYRFTWIRDVAYTTKAFLRVGAQAEAKAAFAWILRTIRRNGPRLHVFYTLEGEVSPKARPIRWEGYRGSLPVQVGNQARSQLQLGVYGDLMETAKLFAGKGHILDATTRDLLVGVADQCVRDWQKKDAGMWELDQVRHYTMSKIECWLALDNAVTLAREGHLPTQHADRWERERAKILAYIDQYCWSETKRSYTEFTGSESLDAALLLATRFGFPREDRLDLTRAAIQRELCRGPLVYRYSGAEHEEGAFLACSFWLVEAFAFLGHTEQARQTMDELLALVGTRNLGLLNEMADPDSGTLLGNLPQGLSHLALIHAALALTDAERGTIAQGQRTQSA